MERLLLFLAIALLAFFAWDVWANDGEWGRDAGQAINGVVNEALTGVGLPAR